jgi:hypothetical protein
MVAELRCLTCRLTLRMTRCMLWSAKYGWSWSILFGCCCSLWSLLCQELLVCFWFVWVDGLRTSWKCCNVLNCSFAVVSFAFKRLGVVLSVKRCGFVIFNGTGERSLLV